MANNDDGIVVIDMLKATARAAEYGIRFESAYVFKMAGKGLHNRHHPHRIKVWDNTNRPNPHPGQIRHTDHGSIGGEGRYLDPFNQGTDSAATVTTSAEAIAITNSGTNTGTVASGQVYASKSLAIGQRVTLRTPQGEMPEVYVVTAQPFSDPILVLCGNDA
jgi:hypothetical protein